MEFVLCHTPLCISFEPHVLPVAIASGQRRFRGAVVRAFAYQLLSGRPRSRRLSRRLRVASKGASHDRGSPIRPCPKRTVHRCTKWPLSRPTIIGIALSDALSCNTRLKWDRKTRHGRRICSDQHHRPNRRPCRASARPDPAGAGTHLLRTGLQRVMGGERLDTRNPTSKLMLTILAGVAAWSGRLVRVD
jgi:hypothetical protein